MFLFLMLYYMYFLPQRAQTAHLNTIHYTSTFIILRRDQRPHDGPTIYIFISRTLKNVSIMSLLSQLALCILCLRVYSPLWGKKLHESSLFICTTTPHESSNIRPYFSPKASNPQDSKVPVWPDELKFIKDSNQSEGSVKGRYAAKGVTKT